MSVGLGRQTRLVCAGERNEYDSSGDARLKTESNSTRIQVKQVPIFPPRLRLKGLSVVSHPPSPPPPPHRSAIFRHRRLVPPPRRTDVSPIGSSDCTSGRIKNPFYRLVDFPFALFVYLPSQTLVPITCEFQISRPAREQREIVEVCVVKCS